MNKTDFNKFADEYRSLHTINIQTSGETPEFFAEYKIVDTLKLVRKYRIEESLKILDFGSGIGNSVPFFAKYFPQAKLTCVDVSERCIEVSKERFPDMAVYQLFNGDYLPFTDESFQLVFAACVFHHIPEYEHEKYFKELLRVLTKGGMLIIFEHNPRNPLTIRAVKSCPFDENAILIGVDTLTKRLKSAGFKKIRYSYRIFFPNSFKYFRFLESVIQWVPLGAQYSVVGRKFEPV